MRKKYENKNKISFPYITELISLILVLSELLKFQISSWRTTFQPVFHKTIRISNTAFCRGKKLYFFAETPLQMKLRHAKSINGVTGNHVVCSQCRREATWSPLLAKTWRGKLPDRYSMNIKR